MGNVFFGGRGKSYSSSQFAAPMETCQCIVISMYFSVQEEEIKMGTDPNPYIDSKVSRKILSSIFSE